MKKKILASLLAIALIGGAFAGCSNNGGSGSSTPAGGSGETVSLKVWGPQNQQEQLSQMAAAFQAAHPEKTYNITFGVVGEGDAQTTYSQDPAAAADVFMFENGQTNPLVRDGALYEVTRNKDDIVARNMPASVTAASVGESLYGYPMTADNGYFLYYDKSVFTEEDVKTLDQILKVANEKGKKVFMDISNGYYLAAFFLGAGCTMSLDDAGNQVLDFNNAKGLAAAEAVKAFTADPAFLTGDDSVLTGGMGDSIAAGVSGIWNAEALLSKLGDNYAAVKLPTFTAAGEQKQMMSFGGYKLVGVNSLTKFPVDAMNFADFITNEENQIKRFEAVQWGPSNVKAAGADSVKANLALTALNVQNEFALPQNSVSPDYWNPAEAFGIAMEAKDYSKSLQEQLDAMVAQIQAAK